ncbi:ABC transporter permease [Microvirga brassicacearum]|uniref:ABC transporter permease n=2 Tax=Microvirga brassicacearum TaxID=2580413 RepID=A0A5N3PDF2_9HYPH|nr:ABC transporter permease [Microvirga brassicacearum]
MRAGVVAFLAPSLVLLTIFVLIPLGWVIRISFNENVGGAYMRSAWVLDNYIQFLGSTWYLVNTLWYTVYIAFFATVLSALLAYPVALYIARSTGFQKSILMTLVLSPLLIGLVTLVYGWIVIFRGGGILNSLLIGLGVYDEPAQYMWNIKGVVILLVYIGMPYMTMSLLDSIERINPFLAEAARNVGANRWTTFWKITFPLTMPGLYAGLVIVFTLNFAAFAVPLMVGPDETRMIGLLIYKEALINNNLPFASSISVIMIAASSVTIIGLGYLFNKMILNKLEAKK